MLACLVLLDALGCLLDTVLLACLLLACLLLLDAGCLLLVVCIRFAGVAVRGCLLLVLKKAYSLESRVVAFPLSRETMLMSLYP